MKKLLLLCALWASLPAMPQLKDVYGYLYCHMSRRGEWTAFALSRDGEEWHDLNQGNEVYDTRSLSGIEGGARDAYITRASGGKGFVMVTTDMCGQKPEVVQLRYQPVAEQRPYTLGVCYVRFP